MEGQSAVDLPRRQIGICGPRDNQLPPLEHRCDGSESKFFSFYRFILSGEALWVEGIFRYVRLAAMPACLGAWITPNA